MTHTVWPVTVQLALRLYGSCMVTTWYCMTTHPVWRRAPASDWMRRTTPPTLCRPRCPAATHTPCRPRTGSGSAGQSSSCNTGRQSQDRDIVRTEAKSGPRYTHTHAHNDEQGHCRPRTGSGTAGQSSSCNSRHKVPSCQVNFVAIKKHTSNPHKSMLTT